ncbi:MAG: TraB/GumN family protein [Candidatus Kapabacteria bacterium]|nr:TraB/GumN family protein [Candidatus Kapabacteria bacterium]
MKKISSIILLVLSFIISSNAQNHFFWKIESSNSTLYLLGSIHFGKKTIYPLDSIIEKSFESSDNLVIEMDVNHVDKNILMKKSFYNDGSKLNDHISQNVYELIKKKFAVKGIKEPFYEKMMPWLAFIRLQQLDLLKSGFSPEEGIDMHFINNAEKVKKSILSLETLDDQINTFEKVFNQVDSSHFEKIINDFESQTNMVDTLFEVWKRGSLEEMTKLALEDSSDSVEKKINSIMLDERNIRMYSKLIEFMTEKHKYFVVLGAAHLCGENGLVNLFSKNNKYKITKL